MLSETKPRESGKRYEIIEHTADVGIRVYGETLPQLFRDAAIGMLSIIAELDSIDETVSVEVKVQSDTLEDLFVAWLSELIFQHEVQEVFWKRVEILQFDERKILAKAYGEEKNPQKHLVYTEIKNVTYHQLSVEQFTDGTWEAQVIFDI